MTASAAALGRSTIALPAGIRSRIVNNINGLAIHMLEAGFETNGRPLILLLHGFPELAYSWRKIMGPLAAAGYHVVAPDQRGYGRTTGWDDAYDGDLDSFRLPNLVRDALGLVSALGYRSVAAVIGHDFGSPVAAYCALIRPDVFRSVALMSAPFGGPPQLPFNTAEEPTPSVAPDSQSVFEDLARLDPPRKHYQRYYQTREANDNMWRAPQGVHAFLRAYYHYKSADWTGNKPFKLAAFSARELARMPTYYIMDLAKGWRRPRPSICLLRSKLLHADGLLTSNCPSTPTSLREPDFRAACNGIDACQANSSANLKCFPAAPSTCPRVSSPAKAIGAPISFRARLRGWRPWLVRNGVARISSMAPDIGFSRNSPRQSVVCCCSSSMDKRRRGRSIDATLAWRYEYPNSRALRK
jgi:pimeloyl-ACP methyl ester carboxylesterase